MILCVDIGNSQVKAGLYKDGSLVLSNRFGTKDLQSTLLKFAEANQCMQIVVASVGARDLSFLNNSPIPVFRINSQTPVPLAIEYKTIETLGVDRLLGVVAANERFKNDQILVIDAGTCVTYDICDRGVYKGGAISPGLQMRLNAMHDGTARLPLLQFSMQSVTIGTTTESSMMMGAGAGLLSEVEGMINRFKIDFPDLKVILTGGDSTFFEQHVKNAIFAAPNFILDGLHTVYQHNVSLVNE